MRYTTYWAIALAILVLAPTGARGETFCFATASTYYEQLYCELKARGRGDRLPPLYEFKRNDANVQASLLRGPARRMGIDVPAPSRGEGSRSRGEVSRPSGEASQSRVEDSLSGGEASRGQREPTESLPARERSKETLKGEDIAANAGTAPGCQLEKTRITCGEREYQLQGNQHNRNLAPDALDSSQKMNLSEFRGNPDDDTAVARYLREAYQQYIQQMLAIGLGGVTMSYSKFAFLFDDIQDKGLDFSQRFETMYGYLKKDKANMSVSEQLATDSSLTLDRCAPLTANIVVCDRGGRNYIYQSK